MRTALIGAAMTLLATGGSASAQSAPPVVDAAPSGSWDGGLRAPGGYAAYREPVYGYRLSEYWRDPTFVVTDYEGYDLRPPAFGYTWSRFYDDAVLTDQWGRVYDARRGIDWSRRHVKRPDEAGRGDWRYDGSWSGTWRDGRYDGTWKGGIRKVR